MRKRLTVALARVALTDVGGGGGGGPRAGLDSFMRPSAIRLRSSRKWRVREGASLRLGPENRAPSPSACQDSCVVARFSRWLTERAPNLPFQPRYASSRRLGHTRVEALREERSVQASIPTGGVIVGVPRGYTHSGWNPPGVLCVFLNRAPERSGWRRDR